jgi:hypothetical protein
MAHRPVLLATLLVWIAPAVPALAQEPLTDLLSFLLTNQSVPTGDFVKDTEAALVTRDTMTRLLLVELATLPISTSSAGFAYRLNPALGTVERASESFGPFFTERSLTAGRGQVSFGAAFTTMRFTHLDDRDLRDGQFVSSGNQFRDEPEPFDIETLTLDLESRTVTFFGNVGVTDRLDVSVAVPLVSMSLSGVRWNTYRGASLLQASADGQASGFGDIAVRTKYRLAGARETGVAVVGGECLPPRRNDNPWEGKGERGWGGGGEPPPPTGRSDDLLGAGRASWRGMLVGSAERGRVSAHVNGGLSVGGLSNEQHYRGALTVSASPHVTLIGELLGRRIEDAGRVSVARASHPSIVGVDTLRLVTDDASTHTTVAVTGVKWNLAQALILSGNLSVPLTTRGLRPRLTALVGLDYAFGN